MLFFFRPYLSIRLSIVSNRIFASLFTCCSSFDRIYLSVSLSCRTGSFPLSLHVVLLVRPYLSIRLVIVLYWIFSSLFACCSSFDRIYRSILLLCCTGSFPLSLSVILILFLFFFFVLLLLPILLLLLSSCFGRGIDIQWIRMHLSHRLIVLVHGSVTILSIGTTTLYQV